MSEKNDQLKELQKQILDLQRELPDGNLQAELQKLQTQLRALGNGGLPIRPLITQTDPVPPPINLDPAGIAVWNNLVAFHKQLLAYAGHVNQQEWIHLVDVAADMIGGSGGTGGGGGGGGVSAITAGSGLSGGTITNVGTIALASPVAIANGGTGATTVAGARANLQITGGGGGGTGGGVVEIDIGNGLQGGTAGVITDVVTISLITPVTVANGGTGAATGALALDHLSGAVLAAEGWLQRAATGAWTVGNTVLGPIDMGGFAINNLSPVPNLPNGAAPASWVQVEVASWSLYQGSWRPDTNTPDLSQNATHQNDFAWIVITPDYTQPVTVAASPPMPGLNNQVVYNSDHIIWSSVEGRFDIIRGGSLTLDEADQIFISLAGGTMTGPLILSANATAPLQAVTLQQMENALPSLPMSIAQGGTGATTGFVALDHLSGAASTAAGALTRASNGQWSFSAAGTSGGVVVSPSAPGSPFSGELWWNSSTQILQIYDTAWHNVGQTGGGGGSYAPSVNPTGGANNYAPLASPSFTGTVALPSGATVGGSAIATAAQLTGFATTAALANYVPLAGNVNVTGYVGFTGTGGIATSYDIASGRDLGVSRNATIVGTCNAGNLNTANWLTAGAVRAPTIQVDSQFYFVISGNSALINWWPNWYDYFDRTNGNRVLAGYKTATSAFAELILDGAGSLSISGNFSSPYQVACNNLVCNQINVNNDLGTNAGGFWLYVPFICSNGLGINYVSFDGNYWAFGWDGGGNNLIAWSNGSGAHHLMPNCDERLKQDIAPSQFDCLAMVDRLPLYQYRWKDNSDPVNPKPSQGKDLIPVGFVAQRLEEIWPEAVLGKEELEDGKVNWHNADTNTILALLVGAVQQLSRRLQ